MKKTLFVLSLFVGLGTAQAQIPTNGLIDHYTFNGNLTGSSGHTLSNATGNYVSDRNGNPGSSHDVTISIDSASIPGLPVGNAARSVAFWYKSNAQTTHSLFNYGNSSSNYFGVVYIANPSSILVGGSAQPDYSVSHSYTGDWTHIAVTHDGSTTTIYINGVFAGSSNFTFAVPSSPQSRLGRSPFGGVFSNYRIDDLLIYNRALSGQEVSAIYAWNEPAVSLPIPTLDLQLYYPFDGNLNDYSGNERTATVTGNYSYVQNDNTNNQLDSAFVGSSTSQLYYDYGSNTTDFKSQNYTCLTWVKIDDAPNTYINLMENGDPSGGTVYFRFLNISNGQRIQLGNYNQGSLYETQIDVTEGTTLGGTWHLVAATSHYDAGSSLRTNRIYYDGVEIASSINSIQNHSITGNRIYMAGRSGTSNMNLVGALNAFAYYNRALTAQEIEQYMDATALMVGVEALQAEDHIKLYPNPAGNWLVLSGLPEGARIKLADATGRFLGEASEPVQSEQTTLNTENLPNGVYFARIESKAGIWVKKFVISK